MENLKLYFPGLKQYKLIPIEAIRIYKKNKEYYISTSIIINGQKYKSVHRISKSKAEKYRNARKNKKISLLLNKVKFQDQLNKKKPSQLTPQQQMKKIQPITQKSEKKEAKKERFRIDWQKLIEERSKELTDFEYNSEDISLKNVSFVKFITSPEGERLRYILSPFLTEEIYNSVKNQNPNDQSLGEIAYNLGKAFLNKKTPLQERIINNLSTEEKKRKVISNIIKSNKKQLIENILKFESKNHISDEQKLIIRDAVIKTGMQAHNASITYGYNKYIRPNMELDLMTPKILNFYIKNVAIAGEKKVESEDDEYDTDTDTYEYDTDESEINYDDLPPLEEASEETKEIEIGDIPPQQQQLDPNDPCATVSHRGRRLIEAEDGIACERPTKPKPEEHLSPEISRSNLPDISDFRNANVNKRLVQIMSSDTGIPVKYWLASAYCVQESYRPPGMRRRAFNVQGEMFFYSSLSNDLVSIYISAYSCVVGIPGTNSALSTQSASKNLLTDLWNDAQILLGGSPYTYIEQVKNSLIDVLNGIDKDYKIIGGHSLGASVAHGLANKYMYYFPKWRFVGYNEGASYVQYFNNSSKPNNLFYGLHIKGDLISAMARDIDYEFIAELDTNSHSMSQFVKIFSL